jgi:hypothetical protein
VRFTTRFARKRAPTAASSSLAADAIAAGHGRLVSESWRVSSSTSPRLVGAA